VGIRFKLDIPEFQGCFQPKEFLVIEKIEKNQQKEGASRGSGN
jgi:hypothetical protein